MSKGNRRRMDLVAWTLLSLFGATVSRAQASDVDWKFYGGAALDGVSECFYEANGIIRGAAGHIRVWTKCIPQKDIESIDIEKDFAGKILKNTADKVAHYYVPPIESVETADAISVTLYEETADIAHIQPTAQIFYEIHCQGRMLRELSISLHTNGTSGSRDGPSNWRYVAPEGNAATLLSLLCTPQ
jgi:hypothetical protein